MGWILLMIAGAFEIVGATGLRYTNGFTRLWPTVFTLAAFAASMGALAISTKTLPLGTAYAIWTGIGTVGTVGMGICLFGEPATLGRLACIALIVGGIVGLKLVTSH
jgi:quaternary ammonium compound-resistance protein SugE